MDIVTAAAEAPSPIRCHVLPVMLNTFLLHQEPAAACRRKLSTALLLLLLVMIMLRLLLLRLLLRIS